MGLALAVASAFATRCATQRLAASPQRAGPEPAATAPPSAPPVTAPAAIDAFRDVVQPMLARRCAPCHVPGGKMYGKLPFDDPAVVRSHEPGILRRIKEPADRDPLIAWLRSAAR